MSDESLLDRLRTAYDAAAAQRNAASVEPWKAAERDVFLARLRAERARTLLEIGAGPGVHGAWFRDQGLNVVCTDLSPEHVRLCREKGLEAHEAPFADLGTVFGERRFDAVFALNCLLHVPRTELLATLKEIHAVVRPGGLVYWGQYGGEDWEGIQEHDQYEPKRFFASLAESTMRGFTEAAGFRVEHATRVPVDRDGRFEFLALTLRV